MTIILNGTTGITTPGITNQGVVEFTAGSVGAPSITTTSDTNTGIYFPAADTIAFTEGGVESLRINSSGNVGIGTASPARKLDVNGTVRIADGQSIEYGGTTLSIAGSSNTFQFFTSSAERMRLDSSGNLGIGTTSPATRLDVAGTVTARNSSNQLLAYSAVNTNQSYAIYLDQDNAGSKSWSLFDATASQTAIRYYPGASGFWQFYTNNTERMRLDSSGNLGIGTTSPAYPLQVRRPGGACSLGLTMDNYGAIAELARSIFYYAIGDSTSDRTGHLFFTRDATATDNLRLVINSSGNVGIGTASPSFASGMGIAINGGAGQSRLALKNNNTGDASTDGLQIGVAADSSAFIEQRENSHLYFATNATERARITSAGDFCIGKTTPSESATTGSGFGFASPTNDPYFTIVNNTAAGVNGCMYLNRRNTQVSNILIYFMTNNGTTSSAIGSITHNGTATAYNTSSDRRLKDNIALADNAGSVIDAIEVVKHDWKAGGHTRYGMIAQDLHIVVPEAVSVGDADDVEDFKNPWGVDYSKLVPMMMKELQSLRKRVAELESK